MGQCVVGRSSLIAVIVLLVFPVAGCGPVAPPRIAGKTTPLHEKARDGALADVEGLLRDGADPNAPDETGRTPLHWAASNGHMGTVAALLKGGADPNLQDADGKTPLDYAKANNHGQTAGEIERAMRPSPPAAAEEPTLDHTNAETRTDSVTALGAQGLSPSLKYTDLPTFEAAIAQPGCLMTSEHVWLFAPKSREEAAGIVFPYLVQAYGALRDIVGVDTEYIIVVYNFPKGNQEAFGGTGNCVIYYDETNLDLGSHPEWTQYHVPHVSGYIEEMAHNFVAATKAQFGWEMLGWSIGVQATHQVASNPIFVQDWTATYQNQADTYQRYVAAGYVLPADVPPNLVDRIHAYILAECERQYGPSFWKDCFAEIRKEASALRDAIQLGDGDPVRNERYRITIGCIDRLPGLDFKQMLQNSGISLTTDVKSLHPTEPGWNRRLR